MTALIEVESCIADQYRCWFQTGHDDAWSYGIVGWPQRPRLLAAPCAIDTKLLGASRLQDQGREPGHPAACRQCPA